MYRFGATANDDAAQGHDVPEFLTRSFTMNVFKNDAVAAVFNAIMLDVSYTEKLLDQGIGDRATARPFALTWAASKYGVKLVEGQRGLSLDQTSAKYETARKAVQRVLDVCFPDMEKPQAAPKESKQVDEVAKLLKSFAKLTSVQKKKFLAAI